MWVSIQCKCNNFANVTITCIDVRPRPLARPGQSQLADCNITPQAPSRRCKMLKTRVKSEQTLLRNRVWKSRELVAIRCIADDFSRRSWTQKGAIARRMRSSRTHCVYIPDVPASQPSSEVPVLPTSPCLLLALRRQAVPSREKELFDMFR
jgi:hypothetical protein